MKNKILLLGIATLMIASVLVAGFPVVSQAVSPSGLTAQQVNAIMSLLQSFGADQGVISRVQGALNGTPVVTTPTTPVWCHTFNTDLTVGNRGADVRALNDVLSKEDISDRVESQMEYFDENTAGHIVRFQAKYGIRQTGYVGPLTRAKLNSIYGCGSIIAPQPSVTITSGTQTASLTPTISGTASGGVSQVGVVLASKGGDKVYGSGYIPVTNGSWSVTVSPALIAGQYEIYVSDVNNNQLARGTLNVNFSTQICPAGYYLSGASCIPLVTIPITSFNPLPVDQNITGQATLVGANEDKVLKWNQNGYIHGPDWKWEVNLTNVGTVTKTIKRMILAHNTSGEGWATDTSSSNPVGKSLYILGTTMSKACGGTCEVLSIQSDNLSRQIPARGSYEFYAYGYPSSQTFSGGYLYVEFTDGTSAKVNVPASSIRPGVGDTNTQPSITVLSPNGGESYGGKDLVTIKWNSTGGDRVAIYLAYSDGAVCYVTSVSSSNIDYTFTPYGYACPQIPRTITSGQYKVNLYLHKNGEADPYTDIGVARDSSDSQFTITAPTTPATFSVSLIDASSDKVSTTFNPGMGVRLLDPNANDWHWRATIGNVNAGKTISAIDIIDENSGQGWSTANNEYYPMAVLKNGVQMNSQYGQRIDIPAGTTVLDLYGQPELTPFPGGVATIKFTDGTSMNVTLSSSNIKQDISSTYVKPTIDVSLIDASSDKVSTTFSPGFGVRLLDPNANDWHWRATISGVTSYKIISSIDVIDDYTGQAWSTADNQYYPMAVFKGGVKINTKYGDTFTITPGTTVLDLYGQPELTPFPGGIATIKFTDGTSASTTLPSSTLKQAGGPVSAGSNSSMSASILDGLRKINPGLYQ